MNVRSQKLPARRAPVAPGPSGGLEPTVLSRRHLAAALGALAAAGLLGYCNTFGNPFVYDDGFTIVANPNIRHLLPLGRALTGPTGSGSSGRPLVALSLALNYALGGLHVLGYHLFNLAVHVLAAWTLFGVARRTFMSPPLRARFGGEATALGFAVALLWMLHPLHTAAIDHVSYRNELLMGLFYLLTLYCVIRGVDSARTWKWHVAAAAACLLGMASKEVMATAPLLVLLYDRTFLAGSFREALRRRRGLYVGLAATWVPLALLVASGNRGASVGLHLEDVTPLDYARTQFAVVVQYLRLAFWPNPLVIDYYWRIAKSLQPVLPQALLVAALGAATLMGLVRRPALGYLGAWCFIVLAPTSSFVPLTGAMAAEHRMYLPVLAPVVLVVTGGWVALERLAVPLRWTAGTRRGVEVVLVAVLALALGARTVVRNADYHSEARLWESALAAGPDNPRAHNNLGAGLAESGKIDEAMVHYREALRITPDYPGAHNNTGSALVKQGKLDEAISEYEAALKSEPNYAAAHRNLASVLIRKRRFDEALVHLNTTLWLEPENGMARLNVGQIELSKGKTTEGIASLREAIRLQPDLVEAHQHLGLTLLKQGDYAGAVAEFRATLVIDPKHAAALNNLAWLLATCPDDKVRDGAEAVRRAEQAGQAGPAPDPDVLDTMGAAYAEAGRFDDAIATAEKARKLAADAGHAEQAQKLESRLALYRKRKPFRIAPTPSPRDSRP